VTDQGSSPCQEESLVQELLDRIPLSLVSGSKLRGESGERSVRQPVVGKHLGCGRDVDGAIVVGARRWRNRFR
jgi:hypothetical protein